jgi:hypothetical protein
VAQQRVLDGERLGEHRSAEAGPLSVTTAIGAGTVRRTSPVVSSIKSSI